MPMCFPFILFWSCFSPLISVAFCCSLSTFQYSVSYRLFLSTQLCHRKNFEELPIFSTCGLIPSDKGQDSCSAVEQDINSTVLIRKASHASLLSCTDTLLLTWVEGCHWGTGIKWHGWLKLGVPLGSGASWNISCGHSSAHLNVLQEFPQVTCGVCACVCRHASSYWMAASGFCCTNCVFFGVLPTNTLYSLWCRIPVLLDNCNWQPGLVVSSKHSAASVAGWLTWMLHREVLAL